MKKDAAIISKIFKILLKEYSGQRWWPTTLKGSLYPSYHGKKNSKKQKFEIIIGAVLAQNTSWKNAEKAIYNLNRENLLDIGRLEKITEKKLAELIKPAGYYNQKAKKIKQMIRFLMSGKPVDRKNLLSVWGVGRETADSILLYAYDVPVFVIDAYTKRIFSRLGFCDEGCDYDELQKLFMDNLVAYKADHRSFNEYHALLVEHAKRHCRKTPECEGCPIKAYCRSKIDMRQKQINRAKRQNKPKL